MNANRFTKLELYEPPDEGSEHTHGNRGKHTEFPVSEKAGFGVRVKDARFFVEQARKRDLDGDHENALRSYSAALGENPLLLEAWVGQLLMLLELDECPEARIWADKALETFPENPFILAAKSVALHRIGRRREARDLSDSAVTAMGDASFVWLCRGEVVLLDSDTAADHCFRNAIRLAKDKGRTRLRIGAILLRNGKYGLALSMLREASSELPRSAWAWYLTGLTQLELGLWSDSQTSFSQAAQLCPGNSVFTEAARKGKPGAGLSIASFLKRVFGK